MSFDMDTMLAAMADRIEAADNWQQVEWTDSPEESATTDSTYAHTDPTRGAAVAMSSAGGCYVYRWELRFVRHVDPSSKASAVEAVQAVARAIDRLNFTTNWPADVQALELLDTGSRGALRVVPGSRALTMTWQVRLQVYEAAGS